MHKVVIDTNVLVSALISKGKPYFIYYELIATKKIKVHISESIINEYVSVLSRSKFTKYRGFHKNSQLIILNLYKLSSVFFPNIKIDVIKDVPDNRFLELAVFSKADFLITGNTNDFNIGIYKGVNIITPSEYWNLYWKNEL